MLSLLELASFTALVLLLTFFDVGLFSRSKTQTITLRSALYRLSFYFAFACVIAIWFYFKTHQNNDYLIKFATGYILEVILSIDNVFVFIVVFNFFAASKKVRYIVLFWGIIISIVMRGIFIFLGVAVINKFHFALVFFGGFLIYTSIKVLYEAFHVVSKEDNIEQESKIIKFLSSILPISNQYNGTKLSIVTNGKRYLTPTALLLFFIGIVDLVFSVDSIPAVFAVTTNFDIIYISNVLGILGLRSLYFIVESFLSKFYYLKFALGAILMFIGLKLVSSAFLPEFIPSWCTIAFIFSSIIIAVIFSIKRDDKKVI